MEGKPEMTTTEQYSKAKELVAAKAGYADTDRFDRESRLIERERCGQMLAEYIAQGRTSDEVVAYAQSLLRTDY
jgi:hypothetical protein